MELLISVTVLSIIMLSIYSAFHTGMFGWRDIGNTIDIYEAANRILERLNLDIRNSFAYSQDESRFKGISNRVEFLTTVDLYQDKRVISEYAFVSYLVENDKLMRICRRGQDSLNEKSDAIAEEISSDVGGLAFSYGYLSSGGRELKFVDSWPSGNNAELPLAVKVSFGIKDKNFERVIYIPIA